MDILKHFEEVLVVFTRRSANKIVHVVVQAVFFYVRFHGVTKLLHHLFVISLLKKVNMCKFDCFKPENE